MNRVIELLFRTIAQPLKMLCHPVMGILIAYLLAIIGVYEEAV